MRTALLKATALVIGLIMPILSLAQNQSQGLDEKINNWVQPISQWLFDTVMTPITIGEVSIPIVLIVLILGATGFTIYFRFVNITKFKLAIDVVRGKYTPPKSKPRETDDLQTIQADHIAGEVSHFQALTAALSATVGLGNIAGVAIAISLGGPGATFWMIIAGLLGMSSKFTECTLGVCYRETDANGTVYGGPMYYLSKGLKEKGLTGLGKGLAIFFAVACMLGSFGGGNMFQANQSAQLLMGVLGVESSYGGFVYGLVLAILVGVVIIGGIKRIGTTTEKIVPLMCGVYVLAAVVILIGNIGQTPSAFAKIFTEAFAPMAVTGGFVGVLIQGFQRAAFSNEAGVGSASIAHAAVRTKYPASEGLVGLLEPFIDTVVVCTMTALVIIITGEYLNSSGDRTGIELTSAAFGSVYSWFPYVLTVAVILFSFSTMLSWSYYGLQACMYLFGQSKIVATVYKIIFCVFIVIGAAAGLDAVITFSDAMVFAMIFPNMIGLILLAPVVKRELNRYLKGIETGEIKTYKK